MIEMPEQTMLDDNVESDVGDNCGKVGHQTNGSTSVS